MGKTIAATYLFLFRIWSGIIEVFSTPGSTFSASAMLKSSSKENGRTMFGASIALRCDLLIFASLQAAKLTQSAAPPLPTQPYDLAGIPCGVVRSAEGLSERELFTLRHWRLAPHRENCVSPATACAVYPFAHLRK